MIAIESPKIVKDLFDYATHVEPICTYSNYPVWAKAKAKIGNGHVTFSGFNVEVINYSLTKHAEEMAILRALSEAAIMPTGTHRIIEAVAVQTASEDFIFPCGSCRQFIAEFAVSPEIPIYAVNADGRYASEKLGDLFPNAFDNLD